jgi:threonine/homoserine/homoserine lactone efflux protein
MELTLIIAFFIQGAGLAIPAATSPGPFQTLLLSETLIGGFRRSAPIAFAPLITDAPIIVLMLFILKQLPPIAINVLNLAGGLFVLYIAWGTFKQWRTNESQPIAAAEDRVSARVSLRKGVMLNFLNPNPYLYWGLVTGPILIGALNQSAAYGVAFLIGFYGMFVSVMLILAAIFHQARRLDQRLVRSMLLLSIVILIIFGGLLIRSGLAG